MSKEKNVQQQVDTERKKEHTSVLQNIRKRTSLLVGIVGFALVIFIFESLLGSGASMFSNDEATTVGNINGKKIDRNEFVTRVENTLNSYRQRNQNNDIDDATRTSVIENIWQQYISEIVIRPQFDKIGITVGEDEIYDRVVANPVPFVIQQVSDQSGKVNEQIAKPDGTLDINKWKQVIQNLPAEQEAGIRQIEDNVKSTRYFEKFRALVAKGLYITNAEAKEAYRTNNTKLSAAYVIKRYDALSDSAVKVTDSDIQKYYNDHSYEFMNPETTRKIEYVSFNVVPSPDDLIQLEKDANRVADEFKGKTPKEDSIFMQQESENGAITVQDFTKNTMIIRDSSVFTAAPGTVFGPYNEGAYFKVYKLEGINSIADSGKVRHLLVAYQGGERSTATRSREQAKKLSDSLLTIIKSGGNFEQFVELYSDDGGKQKPKMNFADPAIQDQLSQILFNVNDTNSWRGRGGNYGWIKSDNAGMARAFVEGATENKTGEVFIKESQFGYHIMEVIESSKSHHNSYKVAQIFKLIAPSEETNQKIFAAANQFGGLNNTSVLFDKAIIAQKLIPRVADNVKEGDRELPNLSGAKDVIKWAYTAKKGDVSTFSFPDKHLVAKLSGIKNKGVLPLEDVKEDVKAKVIMEKKAERYLSEFNKKTNGLKNIDEIGLKMGLNPVKTENMMLNTNSIDGLGPDDIIFGTASGMKAGTTSKAIAGVNGVFVLSIKSINTLPPPANYNIQKTEIEQILGGRSDFEIMSALKSMSDIEDHKSRID